jgi:hypothetical protein
MEYILKINEICPYLSDLSPYDYILLVDICQKIINLPKNEKLEQEFDTSIYDSKTTLNFIREYLQTYRDDDVYEYVINKDDVIGQHRPKYPSKYAKIKSSENKLTYEQSESLKNDGIKYIKLNNDKRYRDIFDVSESQLDVVPGRLLIISIILITLTLVYKLL